MADVERGGVAFLLGAGASVDAGMPLVADLTGELLHRLRELALYGERSPQDFEDLISAVACAEPETRRNYEFLFRWVWAVSDDLCIPRRGPHVGVAQEVRAKVGGLVEQILRERHEAETYDPGYLAELASFATGLAPVRVFSLNYDLCVEDACQAAGIPYTTGFEHMRRGEWCRERLRSNDYRLALYKQHGSLGWRRRWDANLADLPREALPIVQVDWRLPDIPGDPLEDCAQLVLGPVGKLQADDPFLEVFYRFHRTLDRVRACVVVGYSYQDGHVNRVLACAAAKGLLLIDVNVCEPTNQSMPHGCNLDLEPLRNGARPALEEDMLRERLEKLGLL